MSSKRYTEEYKIEAVKQVTGRDRPLQERSQLKIGKMLKAKEKRRK